MAYTYDDFVKAAEGSNMMDKFSQQDLVTAQKNPEFGLSMLSLQKDISGATTEEQRLLATEAANQLRKTYGSYALDDKGNVSFAGSYGGKVNDTLSKVENYGPFSYSKDDAYQKLLDAVANPESFSYDPDTDPRMSAYKKAYLREGQRATQNTLAQASAGTGGVPSSFAVTAAQQAGNYYAGQLADIIPTLYEDSYNQYLNDQALKQQGLGALQGDRDFENQQYMNNYSMLLNLLENQRTQEGTEYSRYLDSLNLATQQEQLAADAKQQEFNNAMALYQLLGYMTPEMEKILLGDSAPVTAEETTTAKWYTGSPQTEPVDETEENQEPVNKTRHDPTARDPVVTKKVDQTPSWLNFNNYSVADQVATLKRAGATQAELNAFVKEQKKNGRIM